MKGIERRGYRSDGARATRTRNAISRARAEAAGLPPCPHARNGYTSAGNGAFPSFIGAGKARSTRLDLTVTARIIVET
jgi:hypothetical protein